MTDARHGILSGARANTGPRFVLVFVLVVAIMALQMVVPEGRAGGVIATALSGLALVVAVWASRVTALFLRVVIVIVTAAVLASLVAVVSGGGEAALTVNTIVTTLFVFGAPVAIVVGLRDERKVSLQAVFGALSLYLLLGLFFSFLITLVTRVTDVHYFAQGTDGNPSQRTYFSYVTLATLGYGDLTPATGLGRAIAVFEAILGSLYLVTVVGFIMSRVAPRRPEKPDGP